MNYLLISNEEKLVNIMIKLQFYFKNIRSQTPTIYRNMLFHESYSNIIFNSFIILRDLFNVEKIQTNK